MTDTRTIDMHTHSSASDGTLSPKALMAEAKKAGLSAIALTDHDTMDGIPKAMTAAEKLGIELIPGIEISTEYENCEIHVLGYYVSTQCERLNKQLTAFREFRSTRNVRMIERLREEGFSITMEQLQAWFPDSVITRAHIARYLYETKQIPSIKTAFSRYIGEHCRCYIERPKITPIEAVTLIREAGGLAVLAHPVLYELPDTSLLQLVEDMKAEGLCGIEAIYSENTYNHELYYRALADCTGLFVSGGSDFHGSNKPDIRLGVGKGNLCIPYSILQACKNLLPNT